MHPPDPKKESPESVGAEFGAEGIKELPARVERYGKAKSSCLDVAKYMHEVQHLQDRHISALYRDTAHSLRQCGNYLGFRHYPTVDKVRLHSASLCRKHLLCQLCAIRRSSKTLGAYSGRYEAIHAQNLRLKLFLITLTVKNRPDLAACFNHLYRSQHELWKQKQRGRGSPLDCVHGAVWSYEIKRGTGDDLWHPHLHMLALAETMPDAAELANTWHNITGDSDIVDVRPVHQDADGSYAGAFFEVFKYATKFSDQEPADTVNVWSTLKGRRLIGSAGLFRGVEIPESLLDEPLDGLPYVDLFFRYINGSYRLPVGSRVPHEFRRAA